MHARIVSDAQTEIHRDTAVGADGVEIGNPHPTAHCTRSERSADRNTLDVVSKGWAAVEGYASNLQLDIHLSSVPCRQLVIE